jgi:hypothetical protein
VRNRKVDGNDYDVPVMTKASGISGSDVFLKADAAVRSRKSPSRPAIRGAHHVLHQEGVVAAAPAKHNSPEGVGSIHLRGPNKALVTYSEPRPDDQ